MATNAEVQSMTEILKADVPDHENPPYYRVGQVGQTDVEAWG